jgi:putative lipoic acid-binding regulatory protein
MNNLPPLELLESTHEFSCKFTFKAFGQHGDALVESTRRAAAEVAGSEDHVTWTYRASSGGKHGCVTLDVYVQTAHQVHAVYVELQSLEEVRMLM